MNRTELLDRLNGWLDLVQSLVESYHLQIVIALASLSLLLVIGASAGRRRSKKLHSSLERAEQLLQQIQPVKGLEKNLSFLLEMVGTFLHASSYAFYVYEPKNNNYVLRAVRHQSVDFGNVRPSYSGLVPYKNESYVPPVTLSVDSAPERTRVVEEGEVPLLTIPIKGIGLIRVGPITDVKKQVIRSLDELAPKLETPLHNLVETEGMKTQVEITVHSVKALKNISDIATEHSKTLDLMLRASYKSINADGGIVLKRQENIFQVLAYIGVQSEELERMKQDVEVHTALFEILGDRKQVILNKSDQEFARVPDYFMNKQAEMIAIVELEAIGQGRGSLILYWFETRRYERELLSHGMSSLDTIVKEIEVVMNSQLPVKQLSYSYTSLMKNLARMMDNLNPYTVGYSELMSRYAIIIARELGLPEDEIRDIALAAHLSNIGTLGLSSDLYQKEGKYTEMEFELMKLHSEVGASIINVTTGNKYVAASIMHHHERMDGNGYPSGIKGEEIPIGARIIAVVQTFLAKINGRKNRDPLRFDQALQTLMAASGAQLDAKVVDALVNWFRKKQKNPDLGERSLGSCWEMCCTPSSVCEKCPVYRRTDVNCWTVEGNNCKAHGKTCETCFVHTEYLTRAAFKG